MGSRMGDRLRRAAAKDNGRTFTVADEVPERFRITQSDVDDMASDVRASLGRWWAATGTPGATEGYRRRDR